MLSIVKSINSIYTFEKIPQKLVNKYLTITATDRLPIIL